MDLSYIERVARDIAAVLKPGQYRVVVDKSTVPVKTGDKVAETIKRYGQKGAEFDVVSNPEFLREGCAVADLMHPDRIVVGSKSDRALALMQKLYQPFMAPILVTDINSAELIKHAANSFLALKISYINAVSAICEASGADVEKVADGIGMDKRIGRNFLNAGLGYGGSCFPKDIAAFIAISEQLGVPFTLLKEVQRINQSQRDRFLKAMRDTLWILRDKKIAVWGLTFKGDTDDIRSSVSIDLIADLHQGRRARHRLRSQGHGKRAQFQADPRGKAGRLRAGGGAGRGGAHHRHGMARVRAGGPRAAQGSDGLADGVRRTQPARPRHDAPPGLPLPQHRPARRGEKLKFSRAGIRPVLSAATIAFLRLVPVQSGGGAGPSDKKPSTHLHPMKKLIALSFVVAVAGLLNVGCTASGSIHHDQHGQGRPDQAARFREPPGQVSRSLKIFSFCRRAGGPTGSFLRLLAQGDEWQPGLPARRLFFLMNTAGAKIYRPNVAAILMDAAGRILVGERINQTRFVAISRKAASNRTKARRRVCRAN